MPSIEKVAAGLRRRHHRLFCRTHALQQRQLAVLVVVDTHAEVDLDRFRIGGELFVKAQDRVAGRHLDGRRRAKTSGVGPLSRQPAMKPWKSARRRHLLGIPAERGVALPLVGLCVTVYGFARNGKA